MAKLTKADLESRIDELVAQVKMYRDDVVQAERAADDFKRKLDGMTANYEWAEEEVERLRKQLDASEKARVEIHSIARDTIEGMSRIMVPIRDNHIKDVKYSAVERLQEAFLSRRAPKPYDPEVPF